jgi:hypothetical protein
LKCRGRRAKLDPPGRILAASIKEQRMGPMPEAGAAPPLQPEPRMHPVTHRAVEARAAPAQ